MLVTYPVRVDPHLPRNGHLAKPDGSYTTSSNPSASGYKPVASTSASRSTGISYTPAVKPMTVMRPPSADYVPYGSQSMQQNIVNGMNNGIMSGFGILFDPLTELFTWGEGDYYGWVNATYPVDGDSFTGGVSKGTGSLLPGLATMGLGTTARAGVLAPEVLAARASTGESAARAPGKELVKVEWPANRGFLGTPVKETLKPGTKIDRYGYEGGTFVSPVGVPFAKRALPSHYESTRPYAVYTVVKPIKVDAGTVAPAMGYAGGGVQYELPAPVSQLIADGFLKR
ncbi:TNT domain-containing protein [Nonomuraea sp. NPDC048881]|uniref:TNT domain-containing protein n=1 Tax=Nonomuraea sp. NPDC048881 TaxID=3155030 RepID=UPI003401BA41